MQPFKLIESDRQLGCREIQIEGELDLSVADQLREALGRVPSESTQILISLERCEFIDSTGIAVIVMARNQMADEGRRVAVYGPSSQVLRTLTITGLTDSSGFNRNGLVFANAEDALSAAMG
ncbi:MAG TPA: STAS domain-containing protein [Polyangia bacterium]